jgi:hypothetical protein
MGVDDQQVTRVLKDRGVTVQDHRWACDGGVNPFGYLFNVEQTVGGRVGGERTGMCRTQYGLLEQGRGGPAATECLLQKPPPGRERHGCNGTALREG